MSSPAEEPELKAGHPPAVKVGGMRVSRPHQSSAGDKSEMTKEEQEEFGTGKTKVDKDVVVSGAVANEDKAYPPEAVKSYHENPHSSKEMRPVQQKHNINQPK